MRAPIKSKREFGPNGLTIRLGPGSPSVRDLGHQNQAAPTNFEVVRVPKR